MKRPPPASAPGDKPVRLEVNGILDLHPFHPKEVPDLIKEYLRECRLRDISEVRIIHGKGKGVLRARVQSLLAEHPDVINFGPAQERSGWGATVALLRTRKSKKNETTIQAEKSTPAHRGLLRRLWPWRR